MRARQLTDDRELHVHVGKHLASDVVKTRELPFAIRKSDCSSVSAQRRGRSLPPPANRGTSA